MAQYSIHTTFHKWLQLSQVEQGICIFGNTSSGKTTLCHLLKRYIGRVIDKDFIIEDGKYLYENEINPKSIKPLTIYPKLMQIDNKQQNVIMNIIQVPSRVYQLQPKKRPNLDRIINTICLTKILKQISLVFIIQSKNTASKVELWKKSFQTILDYFSIQSLSEQLFQSILFIASKSDIDKQVFLNRFQLLQKIVQAEEKGLGRKQKYKQLIKIIQKNQSVNVLSKPLKDKQQKADKQIKSIYSSLQKLHKYTIDQNSLEHQIHCNLIQTQHKYLTEYYNQLQKIFNIFQLLIHDLLFRQAYKDLDKLFEVDFNDKLIGLQKQIFYNNNQQKVNERWNVPRFEQRLNQLLEKSNKNKQKCQNLIEIIKLYFNLKTQFSLNKFLQLLSDYGLVRVQWTKIYNYAIEFQLFEQWFSNHFDNLNFGAIFNQVFSELFSQQSQNQIKKIFLSLPLQRNREPQYYNQILEMIELIFPDKKSEDIDNFKKIWFIQRFCQFSRIDIKNSIKQLPKLWELRNQIYLLENTEQANQLRGYYFDILSKMLQNLGYHELSQIIFQNSCTYYSAKKRYQVILQKQDYSNKVKNIFEKYVELLIKMHLYEKAMQAYYRYAENNSQQSVKIFEKIKKIDNLRREDVKFEDNFVKKFIKKSTISFKDYLKQSQIEQITQISLKLTQI